MSNTVGVGIDLVDVERFQRALSRRPHLAERLFTRSERTDALDRPERLAARFAAKEATWKSLGVGLGAVRLHDVEVRRDAAGVPSLHVRGAAARLAREAGVATWHLSMTHTATNAGAIVVGSSS
jgi:holo-[acyl-carrier protein] synthase